MSVKVTIEIIASNFSPEHSSIDQAKYKEITSLETFLFLNRSDASGMDEFELAKTLREYLMILKWG